MQSIKKLKDKLVGLINSEMNPGKLLKVDQMLTCRKDLVQIDKVKSYMGLEGNIGELFTMLDKCKVYAPSVIIRVIGRKHYSGYYHVLAKAEDKLVNETPWNIRRSNLYFKTALLLHSLYLAGKLPFRDDEGEPIAIVSTHCIIEEPVKAILKLIDEHYREKSVLNKD